MVNCPYADKCRDNDTPTCCSCDNLIEKPTYYRPRRYYHPYHHFWYEYPGSGWITTTTYTSGTACNTAATTATQSFYVNNASNTTCSCSDPKSKPDPNSY